MAFVNIGDVLKRADEFEQRLEKYYMAIRDESQDNGVRLLTYYLSRHRRHLKQAMDDLDQNVIEHINRVRLKYDIEFYPQKAFHLLGTPPSEIKGAELLNAAVGYDEELINLYKIILQQKLSIEASIFIENLIKVEERDIVMIKKMIAMDYF